MQHVRRTAGFVLGIAMTLAGMGPAGAVDVYKWVDGGGITHYSQFPPADATPAQRLVLPAAPPDTGRANAHSILRQAQRLAAENRAAAVRPPRISVAKRQTPQPTALPSAPSEAQQGYVPFYVPVVPYPGVYSRPFRSHSRWHRRHDRDFRFDVPPGAVSFGAFDPVRPPTPPAPPATNSLGSVLTRNLQSR
ncbi:MAG: hypothetical protein B7Z66_04980 [Chromatiales bacterium 21-64-14]|nr:MAG: hypothetical protein B7Z66_04980 [Chromatiales bacterium 21-64-14]HQU16455.1 DUF4124 domain-containing protein [Gammaproteobacteria bacterium]